MQKIKSKWRAQKRKEGIVNGSRTSPLPEQDSGVNEISGNQEEADEKLPDESDSVGGEEDTKSLAQAESGEDDVGSDGEAGDGSESQRYNAADVDSKARPYRRHHIMSEERVSRRRGVKGRDGLTGKARTEAEEKPSLRELHNRAYSRSSLHTFKSQPLHRHRDTDRRVHDDRGRGRGRGFNTSQRRGRGQPDMRLRMNAMLEKIKRDLA